MGFSALSAKTEEIGGFRTPLPYVFAARRTVGQLWWAIWHQDVTGGPKQTGLVVPVESNDKSGGPYTVFIAGLIRYTLFDFGQRSALTNAAKRKQLAANLTFNATHQTITFQSDLDALSHSGDHSSPDRGRRRFSAASGPWTSFFPPTQDKFEHGLVTEPNLLQARQAKAQGEFDLVQRPFQLGGRPHQPDQGDRRRTAMRTQGGPGEFATLGNQIQEPLDSFVQSALQKPDLLAKVAEAQAAQASLRAARAAPLPTVSLTAMQNYSQFETTIQGSGNVLSNVGLGFQNYGGFVKVEWARGPPGCENRR